MHCYLHDILWFIILLEVAISACNFSHVCCEATAIDPDAPTLTVTGRQHPAWLHSLGIELHPRPRSIALTFQSSPRSRAPFATAQASALGAKQTLGALGAATRAPATTRMQDKPGMRAIAVISTVDTS
jgi:hypothetical protein